MAPFEQLGRRWSAVRALPFFALILQACFVSSGCVLDSSSHAPASVHRRAIPPFQTGFSAKISSHRAYTLEDARSVGENNAVLGLDRCGGFGLCLALRGGAGAPPCLPLRCFSVLGIRVAEGELAAGILGLEDGNSSTTGSELGVTGSDGSLLGVLPAVVDVLKEDENWFEGWLFVRDHGLFPSWQRRYVAVRHKVLAYHEVAPPSLPSVCAVPFVVLSSSVPLPGGARECCAW
eukprot:3005987-Rhodomonas_salina.3